MAAKVERLKREPPPTRIVWARRMECQLCGALIADHPWPGGMHDETIGEAISATRRRWRIV